jgi:hypothetical protein
MTQLVQYKWQQNWIFTFKTLFPQKFSDVSFTNPKSMVGLQLLNLWLLKVKLTCVNVGVATMKLDIRQLGTCVIWSNESSFRCSLHQVEFRFAEHPRKPTIWNGWPQRWNTGEILWWFGQQYRGTVFCRSHHGQITARSTRAGWVIRCIPWSRRYFRTTMQFPKSTIVPFTQLELFNHGLKSTNVNFNIFPDQHNHQIWTSLNHWSGLETTVGNRFLPPSLKQLEDVL